VKLNDWISASHDHANAGFFCLGLGLNTAKVGSWGRLYPNRCSDRHAVFVDLAHECAHHIYIVAVEEVIG
jgi:hypothetical protein